MLLTQVLLMQAVCVFISVLLWPDLTEDINTRGST